MDLRTLSRHLGLSITTVSRALADYPDVGAQTKRRVAEAARAHGYSPNGAARRLKTGKAEAVGLVLPTGADGWSDPFFAELLAGIGTALAASNLDLMVMAAPAGPDELAALRRAVSGRRVDAIILPRTRFDDARVDFMINADIPFVTHGRTAHAGRHAWLDIDGKAAFRVATERLLSLGHRRIGLINGPLDYTYARHRRAGFQAALDAAGLATDPQPMSEGPATPESGRARALAMLDANNPPTALLCATDRIALGAMTACKERGLAVGQDISIIGYDDLVFAAHTDPPLTTMRQPIRAEGARLVELLTRRIAGEPVDKLQELWPAQLIARQSDGPPRAKSDAKTKT